MRNTKPFNDAVAQTLAELARQGVTIRPGAVADVIETNITQVADRLGIQQRSAWRYFDPVSLAASLARQQQELAEASTRSTVGRPPLPPVDNPELALILAGVPDALATSGGDLYAVIVNVAVNAWIAGHIHGEDGCGGCEDSRGPSGHDWNHRMRQITRLSPDITRWFDRDVFTDALNDSGYTLRSH